MSSAYMGVENMELNRALSPHRALEGTRHQSQSLPGRQAATDIATGLSHLRATWVWSGRVNDKESDNSTFSLSLASLVEVITRTEPPRPELILSISLL